MTRIDYFSSCPCCGTTVRVVSKDSTYSGTHHNCKGVIRVESVSEYKPIAKSNDFMKKIFDKHKDNKFSRKGLK